MRGVPLTSPPFIATIVPHRRGAPLGGQLKTGNLWTGQNRQFLRGGRDQ
jgi:hypothetical protein